MFDPNEELPELAPEVTHERYGQLKGYAQVWAYEHGWMIYEGITEDIQEWAEENHSRTLTEDDCDTILSLLEGVELVFTGEIAGSPFHKQEFPNGSRVVWTDDGEETYGTVRDYEAENDVYFVDFDGCKARTPAYGHELRQA